MNFLVKGAYLLTNNANRDFVRADLRVVEGKIAAIKKNLIAQKGEKVFLLEGAVLSAGFVQTHIHLCQTLFRNLADDLQLLDWLKEKIWPFEAAHNEASLYASARLGIAELLASGTTTILDMGTVRHTHKIFEAAESMGIRAFIGKCLMDHPNCPPGLKENTVAALRENYALAEHWHGKANGRLRYAHAPRFVLSCTEALLKEVKNYAEQHGQLIHTHASENKEEIASVRKMHGCENIEYLHKLGLTGERLVLAHCVWLSEKEKELLRKTHTKVSHCPSSNLKLASGIAEVPDLKARGICVSLGADGAPCNNNLNMFQEMRLASLIQKPQHGPKALPAQEAYEMATLEGAKALGLSHELGSLEIGKKADLIALNLSTIATHCELSEKHPERAYSAIVYSASPANLSHTWVDGRLRYSKGKFPGLKANDILSQALKEQKRLLQRVQI